MSPNLVTVSIVSHAQNRLVNSLLEDLRAIRDTQLEIILTENVSDVVPLHPGDGPGSVVRIRNELPKGFGANHNAAFLRSSGSAFCVLNPDVRLERDPFPMLLETLLRPGTGAVAPLVKSPSGRVEDSARRFPTPRILLRRIIGTQEGPDYPLNKGPIQVDWAAGMFLVFSSAVFRSIGGFDEGYFMYYEDADICRRMGRAGHATMYDPRVEVIHDARRDSHRNPRLALHHIMSIARFLADKGPRAKPT